MIDLLLQLCMLLHLLILSITNNGNLFRLPIILADLLYQLMIYNFLYRDVQSATNRENQNAT